MCLHCFEAGCTGDVHRAHAGLHLRKTGHALAVQIRRTPKSQEPLTRLAVVDVPEEERYVYEYETRCMACDEVNGREIAVTDKVCLLKQYLLTKRLMRSSTASCTQRRRRTAPRSKRGKKTLCRVYTLKLWYRNHKQKHS